ncbi:hypothetical protein [Burkholderia anthina]|uniref:hypothetical protein n=1 Tax=Burkholderia anthina TaxID=179879 RepID=UPI001AA066CE|nr:hypothetical protein [Burkholderia anthina]QTD92646.1 hypothetical protein J4G50_31000 [Burkholderia anthina]
MKRLAISLCGFLFGLLVAWAFVYALSRVHLVKPDHIATGCHELDKCPTPWWIAPVLIAYFFGPAIAFGTLNAIAWKRWSIRTWALWSAAILFVTAALYIVDYLMK